MSNFIASDRVLGRHPRFWAGLSGIVGFIGTYGVLAGFFSATFWPEVLSANDSLVALPLALLISAAFGCLVWYHLAHDLPAWPISKALKDGRTLPLTVRIALLVLIAYIGLVFGEGVTIVIYGQEGPFGEALDGIRGPFAKPLLPLWTWPMAFAAGAGVMHWLCWSALSPMGDSDADGAAAG